MTITLDLTDLHLCHILVDLDERWGVYRIYTDDNEGAVIADVFGYGEADGTEKWDLAWGSVDRPIERTFPSLEAALQFADAHYTELQRGDVLP